MRSKHSHNIHHKVKDIWFHLLNKTELCTLQSHLMIQLTLCKHCYVITHNNNLETVIIKVVYTYMYSQTLTERQMVWEHCYIEVGSVGMQ